MTTPRTDLPQGTLDLLVLQVAATGPIHGYGIAQRIKQISRDVLQVPQGSLYPGLHRLERAGTAGRGVETVGHRPRREVLQAHRQGPRAVAGRDRKLGAAGRGRRADPGNLGRRRAVSWRRVLQRLRHGERAEAELDAELRDHVERQVADHIRAGMSAQEARRRARLEFGGLDQVKELCRDARGTRWLEDISRDLRYAFRRLAADRSLVALAITTLGLGIGLNVTVFSMVHAIFVRGLPYAHPERIVNVWSSSDLSSQQQRVSLPGLRGLPARCDLAQRPGRVHGRQPREPE